MKLIFMKYILIHVSFIYPRILFASQSIWCTFVIFPFFFAVSILASPKAKKHKILVHSAVPILGDAPPLAVAITGSFKSVYNDPTGKAVAHPNNRNEHTTTNNAADV